MTWLAHRALLSILLRRQPFKLLQGRTATSERSVVVITGRCQRLNPGSSPGARTTASQLRSFSSQCLWDERPQHKPRAMSDRRVIFVGKKPLHAYVRAVVKAMEDGDREIQLVARGATISRAVDVAEVCRRRNGHIAQGLPASVNIQHLSCESEEVEGENGMRTVSVLRIDMEGVGDVPERQDS